MHKSPKKIEFLNEVTLRICSSLEVKAALRNAFEYLKIYFPVRECFFQMLDIKAGLVRNIAYTSLDEKDSPTAMPILPLGRDVLEWASTLVRPCLVDRKGQNKYTQIVAKYVGLYDNQDLVLPLRTEGNSIGFLVLRARGQETFTKHHMDLLRVVQRPFSIAMSNALAHEAAIRYKNLLLDDNTFLQNELQSRLPKEIIGAQGGLRHVMEMVRQVGPRSSIVLILGETGVGKEVIANAVHYSSNRINKPLIKLNCGAIPDNLVDSELFGHEKGAFTGAVHKKRGRFERAHTGTLFLDEIGELPLSAQVKLLRVIQHHEIERIGSMETTPVDVRLIAATHRNLAEMIAEKKFREDLWFRINVFPIYIPPLRNRREDIAELAEYFIQRKCCKMRIAELPTFAPSALNRLKNYHWPGNVRELENVIERELILHPKGPLTFIDLIPQNGGQSSGVKSSGCSQALQSLEEAITAHIKNVLRASKGKVSGPGGAAAILCMNESTLRSKMRKLGIVFKRGTTFADER